MRRGVWVFAALVLFALPVQAHAAFPGQNGKIAWSSDRDFGNHDIYSMNADGSGVARLTTDLGQDTRPTWSPNGQEIAFMTTRNGFGEIWVMNADGSNQHRVATGIDPAWSPDGSHLAFTPAGGPELDTIRADGTGLQTILTGTPCPTDPGEPCEDFDYPEWSPAGDAIAFQRYTQVQASDGTIVYEAWEIVTAAADGSGIIDVLGDGFQPSWSPDASQIAFSDFGNNLDLFTMTATGANRTVVSSLPAQQNQVAWSPDGAKLTFLSTSGGDSEIDTIGVDGTGLTQLTSNADIDRFPDWQPIPINSYPRPKGATPFYGSLTTAYEPCTAPDRTHGPPLEYGSCSSPQMTSDYLTVGTGDSTFKPARNEGYLRLGVTPGNPGTTADEADVTLEFFSDDIFTKAIDDYTGELRAKVALQITDKDNTPNPGGPGAATTTSIPLELTVGCTPVADPLEGSSCTASTTADALAPGTVKEGRRSIWGLGRVEVYDGGADGDAQTPAGDTLFATQGLFVP
jgi:hypothetical protein